MSIYLSNSIHRDYENKNFNRNRHLLERFTPRTYEEQRILEIANFLGEKEVRYLKSISNRYGLNVIEDAFYELKEKIRKGYKIQSYPKFMNHLIKKRLNQ